MSPPLLDYLESGGDIAAAFLPENPPAAALPDYRESGLRTSRHGALAARVLESKDNLLAKSRSRRFFFTPLPACTTFTNLFDRHGSKVVNG
jgi:hypothetical protein